MKMFACKLAQDEVTHHRRRVGSQKHALSLPEGSVQTCPEAARREGWSHFDARSVCVIREPGTMASTPLVAFFNRPYRERVAGLSEVKESMTIRTGCCVVPASKFFADQVAELSPQEAASFADWEIQKLIFWEYPD